MNAERILAIVRDVLLVFTCLMLLFAGYKAFAFIDGFGNAVTNLPVECWDPGGGEVCAPGGEDGQ